MALPKPQLNGDVLAYDEKQTDEINRIDDYVSRRGHHANGYWEEYASGLVKIWGWANMVHGSEGQIQVTLPYPNAVTKFIYIGANLAGYNGTSDYYVRSAYESTTPGTRINIYVKVGTPLQKVYYAVFGTYK